MFIPEKSNCNRKCSLQTNWPSIERSWEVPANLIHLSSWTEDVSDLHASFSISLNTHRQTESRQETTNKKRSYFPVLPWQPHYIRGQILCLRTRISCDTVWCNDANPLAISSAWYLWRWQLMGSQGAGNTQAAGGMEPLLVWVGLAGCLPLLEFLPDHSAHSQSQGTGSCFALNHWRRRRKSKGGSKGSLSGTVVQFLVSHLWSGILAGDRQRCWVSLWQNASKNPHQATFCPSYPLQCHCLQQGCIR